MKLTGTKTTPSRAVANDNTANCQQLCDSSANRSPLPRPSAARAAAVRDTAASSSANVSRVSPHDDGQLARHPRRGAMQHLADALPPGQPHQHAADVLSHDASPPANSHFNGAHPFSAPAEAKVTPPARPDDIRQARTPLRSAARSTVRPTGHHPQRPARNDLRVKGHGRRSGCPIARRQHRGRPHGDQPTPVTCLRAVSPRAQGEVAEGVRRRLETKLPTGVTRLSCRLRARPAGVGPAARPGPSEDSLMRCPRGAGRRFPGRWRDLPGRRSGPGTG